MGLTTDPDDPCIKETLESGQQACYLVLSEEERAKGFVRPVRQSYKHVGAVGPQYPLRDLTEEEHEQYDQYGYIKYEEYPPSEEIAVVGCFWTKKTLDRVNNACGSVTTMGQTLAETMARSPSFYGGTFCATCGTHFPVGKSGEFVWVDDGSRVGT